MQEVKKRYDTVDPTKPQHVWLTYETLKKMVNIIILIKEF